MKKGVIMRRMNFSVLLTVMMTSVGFGQSWVTKFSGPKENDLGIRRDAIIEQEFLSMRKAIGKPYAHPSMIDETKEGTLIIMFNAGAAEGSGNDVWITRKPKDGQWSTPVAISGTERIDIGIIYQPRYQNRETIICGYYTNGCCTEGGFRISTDDGVTWSSSLSYAPNWDHGGVYGDRMTFGMNPPLELPNGDVWFASSDINDPSKLGDACITKLPAGKYTSTGDWSSQRIETDSREHYMGTWLVLSPDYQKLMYIARTDFNRGAYFTTSEDGGKTWGSTWIPIEAEGEEEIEFKCGISFLSLDPQNTGSPLHGYHIATGSRHGQLRQGINVAVSTEPLDINKWKMSLCLNFSDKWTEATKIENADPSIIQSRDGKRLHIAWTGREQDSIRHAVIDPYKLCGIDATEIGAPERKIQNTPVAFPSKEPVEMYSADGRRVISGRRHYTRQPRGVLIARQQGKEGTVLRRIMR
jgi:hypothetical protein